MSHILCGIGLASLIAGLWLAWPPLALALTGILLAGLGAFLQSVPPVKIGQRVQTKDGVMMVVEKVTGQVAVCAWQTAAGGVLRGSFLLPDLKRV